MSDFNLKRGNKRILHLELKADDGSAMNLTGATLWFTAKTSRDLPDSRASIRKGNTAPLSGITVTDAATGQATIQITPEDTETLTNDTVLEYDVKWQSPSDGPYTVAEGKLIVARDVTQSRL